MEKSRCNRIVKIIHYKSLFFKLALAFTIGINVLAISLFYVNFTLSEKVFVDIFADSQYKIFSQIEDSFYQFYTDLNEILAGVAKSPTVIDYLTSSNTSASNEMQIIYAMQEQTSKMNIAKYDNLTMLIVGNDNKTYMYGKTELIKSSVIDLLNSSFSAKANENTGIMVCEYQEEGYTSSTINDPVVVFCRAIQDLTKDQVIGYVYLFIREEDMRSLYECFLSGSSDMVILNQDGQVISSNNSLYFNLSQNDRDILKSVVENYEINGLNRQTINNRGETVTYMLRKFSNTDFTIVGMINPKVAFYQKYNISVVILLTVGVSAVVLLILFITLRHQTQSLHKLIHTMKNQKDGHLNGYLDLHGSEEIRQLSITYNEMMVNLNHYVQKVIDTEQEKRDAEFRALQMQINPHYVYNTLASIKWVVMQGDSNQAISAIDAFIALLRNTISDKKKLVTVRQELENLHNYVLINKIRYGNKVKVDFYAPEECMDYTLPKLILQPFIENAFFHAFPNDNNGCIQVFIHLSDNTLVIEIADDGVGMTQERIDSMLKKENNVEHYTGVGINNVDERLKNIYGLDYGVKIESEENFGTTITVRIPVQS